MESADNIVRTHSILSFVFTRDGKMLVGKNAEGKLDTLPWLFLGYREEGSILNFDDSIWVINDKDEYQERISLYMAYQSRNSKNGILNGFLSANGGHLIDVGQLHEKIAEQQIEEMVTLSQPSYIRVSSGMYDGGVNKYGQEIINEIETRYVVMSENDNIEDFPDFHAMDVSEVKRNLSLTSDKIILGVTGSDGERMEKFAGKLKSMAKAEPFRK